MRVTDLEEHIATDVAMTAQVAARNHRVLGGGRFAGWRHLVHADLLIAHGRWFAAPEHSHKSGPDRECFRSSHEAADLARRLVYVEGRAFPAEIPFAVEHAWCVDLDTGAVIETTWPEPGRAYLGIPLADPWRRATLLKVQIWDLLLERNQFTEGVLRDGLPDEATIPVGRPFGEIPAIPEPAGDAPGA